MAHRNPRRIVKGKAKLPPSTMIEKARECNEYVKAVKGKAEEKLVADNPFDQLETDPPFSPMAAFSSCETFKEKMLGKAKERNESVKPVKEKAEEKLVADIPFDQLETDPPFPPMAEFSSCSTHKEKKDWLIAATIIRYNRITHGLYKKASKPIGGGSHFRFLTKQEMRRMKLDLDQE